MRGFSEFDSDDVPVLKNVRMFGDGTAGEIATVELRFVDFTVFIFVQTADDTLVCTRTPPSPLRASLDSPIESSFWLPILGKALVDVWQMTNAQGYADAVQFRFREAPSEGSYTTVQLEAIASRIKVVELAPKRQV